MRNQAASAPLGSGADDADRGTRPRAWRWRLVTVELIHALLFLPATAIVIFLILALPWAIPVTAEAQRCGARWCGFDAPSSRHGEHALDNPHAPLASWLSTRMWTQGFWRQDVPLAVCAVGLGILSFILAFVGIVSGTALAAAPFLASQERPTLIQLGSWTLRSTRMMELWWLECAALVWFILLWLILWGVGWLRARITSALSGLTPEELSRRNAELSQQLGYVSAGRATLIDAFDAERARIERDLHDGAQQDLVALTMGLGMARLHAQSLPEELGEAKNLLLTDLDTAQERTEAALAALRETVHGIRPVVLTERGLLAAVRELSSRAPIPTTLTVDTDAAAEQAITSPVATTIYFAISEALTNTAKYAGPHARSVIDIQIHPDGLRVRVHDDGVGGAQLHRHGATGLEGMMQRLESIGGTLSVESPEGGGTTLILRAPLCPPWGGAHSEDA